MEEKQKEPSVLELAGMLHRHNEKYGTKYTYGKFIDKIRRKEIVIKRGESFELEERSC
ncbi:MAG: hypothetical protein IKY45_05220 [Clostridia bacterium]|nr:hypothetical protein [Clostridia bacterium]